ncbi:MAG: hypothetical protein D9V44_02100 [Actinobacteria bacterium]|nr:MAG: hypothetical protein D9V44_02100 [Actinomycetota bacterium]
MVLLAVIKSTTRRVNRMRRGSARYVLTSPGRSMRRISAALAVLCVAVAASVVWPAVAQAANPHGAYTSSSRSCVLCHDLHVADGDTVLNAPSQKLLCYNCHDGSGSTFNAKAEFGESVLGTTTAKSAHPVPTGVMQCADCHTPHAGPTEGNPGSLSAGSAEATSGVAVCGACHGTGSALPGGNLAAPIEGTPHASLTSSASVAGIGCVACHEPHASSNADLVRATLRTESQTTITVTGEPGLCLGCHQDSGGIYAGASAAGAQKHSTVTSSTKALTSWPGASGTAAGCDGCHEPHGTGSGPSYTRVSGEQLCRTCHDDASLTYPAGYSYRGAGTFSGSGHEGITAPGISYISVLAEPPGFAAWESTVPPTPGSPGTPVAAPRAAALLASDGSRLVTSLQLADGNWDYQTYRFKAPIARGDMTSIRVHWEGYGEEAVGFPVALSAWNVGTGTWDLLQSAQMVTQTTVNLPLSAANHVGDDGYVYLMAKARYSRDEALVSGPTITAINGYTAQVDWVTSGLTSSYVDYGTTSSYTKTAGTATRSQTHSVRITGLTPGVWHFRVRSVALDGSSYTSGDMVQGIPRPTISPYPVGPAWLGTDVLRTFTWAAPLAAPGGPFEFRFFLYKDSVLYSSTDWTTATTRDETLGLGAYTWRVEARDAAGNTYGYSVWGTFYVYDATGSCPFLFTWDGGKFDYEADLYTTGKLASPRANGTYQKPNPNDYYVLENTPVEKDGALELRLVEERFETDYLDTFKLFAVDVPEGRTVVAEKIPQGGTYQPLEDVIHTVSSTMSAPLSATRVKTGEDVLAAIAESDGVYAVLSPDVEQPGYESIELDLGDLSDADAVKLVFEGMSRFPETPEGKALGTAGVRQKVEVIDASGKWVALPGDWPKPAEFARPYMLDLTGRFPTNDHRVRLTFLLKTYVDSVKLDTTADEPLKVTEVERTSAELRRHGVDGKSSEGDIYEYVYGEPNGESGYLPGNYTRFGEVGPLLDDADDKHVIYGRGDEIAMRYRRPAPAQDGMTHTYVVYAKGYYKDLNTDVEKTVEPLPFSAMSNYPYPASEHYPNDAEHVAYQAEWNTRVEGVGAIAPEATSQGMLESAVGWVKATAVRVWDRVVALVTPTAGDAAVAAAETEPLHRSLNTDVVALEVTGVGTASANACAACHAPHGGADSGKLLTGGRGAADGRTCTADGTGACHDNAANSASGIDIRTAFTVGSDARARHDVMPADQRASGGKTACGDCHNPHSNNAEVRFSDPDDPSKTIASPLASLVASDGSVWALVGASHDALAPNITNIAITASATNQSSPTVTWQTLGDASSSWVDWGTTTAYELGNASSGTPFGNNTLVTAHSVPMSSLATGTVYHYRVRSTDALGNTAVSEDRTYKVTDPPPVPMMSDLTTVTGPGIGPIPVAVSCAPVESSDGHAVEYQFEATGQPASGWLAAPSWSPYYYDGAYSARVRARDAIDQQAVSAWSAYDSFVVTSAPYIDSGSCPFLFTWNGTDFDYEADLYTTSKLASQRANGTYQKPNPNDYYVLHNTPAERDGAYELRLVEERFETDYLDTFKLFAVDVPEGRTVVAEKIPQGGTYQPIGDVIHTVSSTLERPLSATRVKTGEDVLAAIAENDGVYATLSPDQERPGYESIELDLGDLSGAEAVKLVFQGMSRFPKTDDGKILGTSGVRQKVEVLDGNGNWVALPGEWPKPAEFARPYMLDLTGKFLTDDYRVRLTFLLKTYVDSVKLDTTADEPLTVTEVQRTSAELRQHGTDAKSSDGDIYEYVYGAANGFEGYFPGDYTRYGEVGPLLDATDDKFVIYGGGDEIVLRFDVPDEPVEGTARSFVVFADGYYKDLNTDVPKTVEPLPFSAMSNYPYPAGEHYPDDAEHVAYQAEWNTRTVGSMSAPAAAQGTAAFATYHTPSKAAATSTRVAFGEYHADAWLPEFEDTFSVDSDQFYAKVELKDGSVTTVTVSAGWESESTEAAKPTPASPGTQVAASSIASLTADDGSYWRTNLATADARWNWQVMRFDLGAIPLADIRNITFAWNGHGEPTPGYPTSVSFWNPIAGTWTQVTRVQMGSDMTVSKSETGLGETFCLRCHDGAPPAGVVFPAGVANIGANWNLSTGDAHGAKAGAGFGSTGLKAPYSRGQGAIPCSACHDAHGTESINHFPSTVNGQAVPPVTSGTNMASLCRACHVGTAYEWHDDGYRGCWCHYVQKYEPGGHDYAHDLTDNDNCLLCHEGHTATYAHAAADAGCACH